MIYGGFTPFVTQGRAGAGEYVQGFLLPVPKARREDYAKMAEEAWPFFQRHGALSVVEAWADDVPHGKQTDFWRAVKAGEDETVVFSYMTCPTARPARRRGRPCRTIPK
ncbi:DUF1428 domain-containing protein [Qipengyuania sediminis]|uniref:DUF1428 domain-containing protein n=1 Tax=Qipengyuania sediminis TaxID=1532023 RepID=UPI003B837653